ncbi:MAG: hypothetical protein KAS32_02690 [Candidatus Peribacteraceae bacterium]|nr:hypothetical protein [Candidatus Peribacteraceae bacterium]
MKELDADKWASEKIAEVDNAEARALDNADNLTAEALLNIRQLAAQIKLKIYQAATKMHWGEVISHTAMLELLQRAKEHYHPNPIPSNVEEVIRKETAPK